MAFGRAKKKISDETVLYECAVAALGRRMRSVAELKRLLRQRVPAGSAGEALIQAVIQVRRLLEAVLVAAPTHELPHPGRFHARNRPRNEARFGLCEIDKLIRNTLFRQDAFDEWSIPAGPTQTGKENCTPSLRRSISGGWRNRHPPEDRTGGAARWTTCLASAA